MMFYQCYKLVKLFSREYLASQVDQCTALKDVLLIHALILLSMTFVDIIVL